MKIVDERTGGISAFETLEELKQRCDKVDVTVTVTDWELNVKGGQTEMFKFLVALGEPSNAFNLGVDAAIENFSVTADCISWNFA